MTIPDDIREAYLHTVHEIIRLFQTIIDTAPVEIPRSMQMTALQSLLFRHIMSALEEAAPDHRPQVVGNIQKMIVQLTALAETEQGQEQATADCMADIPSREIPRT